jgi:polysaccharide biosynthesis transport protein
MDVLFAIKLLLKKKWYLVIVPLLCAALSFFLTSQMKPEFKSVAKLETRFTTEDRITVTAERLNPRDADVKFNNLVETMSSELIVSMLSYQLALNDLTSDRPFREPDIETKALLANVSKDEMIKTLRGKIENFELLSAYNTKEKEFLDVLTAYGYVNWMLNKTLRIGRVQGSDFVNVQFVSEDPFLSAYVVNTLCDESIRYDNYLSTKRSSQSIKFFSNLLEEKKEILDKETAALDTFRQSSQLYGLAGESNRGTEESGLEERRSTIVSNIRKLKLSIESLNRRLNTSLSPQRQNEVNTNIVSIRKRIDELNTSPKGKDDPATQNTLRDLTDQLEVQLGLLEDIRSPGKTKAELQIEKEEKEIELAVAQADLVSLDNLMMTKRKNVSSESTLDALQRQVEKASEEYLDVLNRYNVEKSKAMITSPLQLAIRGQPNEYPEFPKRYLVIGAAWMASFLLCSFIILVKEFTDTRIRTPEHLTLKSGLPVTAAIEMIDTKNLNLNEVFVLHRRNDLDGFKNQLRKLRFEIEESRAQVIMITSTTRNQGKSFLILCLSYLLAALRKRVLVIDTNFRHNSISQALQRKSNGSEADTKLELYEKMSNMANDYPKAFHTSIMLSTDQSSIEAVGNSGSSLSPAEVFVDKDFNATLNTLRQHYDYILLEGPALNDYSDSKELATYADKVIAVFSAESAIRASDRESIDYLKRLDGKLIGAVLNKVNERDL